MAKVATKVARFRPSNTSEELCQKIKKFVENIQEDDLESASAKALIYFAHLLDKGETGANLKDRVSELAWNQTTNPIDDLELTCARIDLIALGAFKHNGQGNYFDMATVLPDETRTYGEKTLDTIEQVLTQAGLFKSTDPQPNA